MKYVYLSTKTHYSNPESLKTRPDRSPSKPKNYFEVLEDECAISFCENRALYNWTEKHQLSKQHGVKYIHGVTVNVMDNLKDGNYIGLLNLYAKNYDGVKELNSLVALSYQGRGDSSCEERHFYFTPRLTLDEVFETTDNVLIVFNGINSPIWNCYINNLKNSLHKVLDHYTYNKNRTWIGISSKMDKESMEYNKYVKNLDGEYNYISIDDYYSHSAEYESVRVLLNKAQSDHYEDDGVDYSFKTLKEIIINFRNQELWTDNEIKQFIDETVNFYNLIEDFNLSTNPKYPRLSQDPIKEIKQHVFNGFKEKGLDKSLDLEAQKLYRQRIVHELEVMQKVDAIDYMLLEYHVKKEMRNRNIFPGPGRGSVGGSLVAYLLQITSVDPIKNGLLFERFINESRVDMQDIDTDWTPAERNIVQEYLLTHKKLTCASIITFGTLGIKSAFKEFGRALGYAPDIMNFATKDILNIDGKDVIPDALRTKYSDICKYVDLTQDLIIHVGRHAAGIIVSDLDLESDIGVLKVKDFDYDVANLDMGEISRLQYLKLDVLGLLNLEWIKRATELAGLDRLHPDAAHINYNDWEVAKDLVELGTTSIFQLESSHAQRAVKDILSEKSLKSIRERSPHITVIDILAILLAVIRPGSASILEDVVSGRVRDNGVEPLNDILKDSYGYMIYQEQAIEYLKFVGFNAVEADNIRRAIGKKKKDVIDKTVPEIHDRSVKKIVSEYGKTEEEAEYLVKEFLQIFLDSAMYSFNKSHAVEYAYIAMETAWLRHYYPLEWITAGMEILSESKANKQDKVNLLNEYAKAKGIKFENAKFRYSKGGYFLDKETNTVYQGTSEIKGNNATTGDELYKFRDNQYNNFSDFLVRLKDDTIVDINDKQLGVLDILKMSDEEITQLDKDIKNLVKQGLEPITTKQYSWQNKTKILSLIRLNYFSEFGNNWKLEKVYEKFLKLYSGNAKTFKTKVSKYRQLIEYENSLEDISNPIFKQCEYQIEYLGRCEVQDSTMNPKIFYVVSIENVGRTYTTAKVHSINKGKTIDVKIGAKKYSNVPFKQGDILEFTEVSVKPKKTKIDGVWCDHPTEKDNWVKEYKRIRQEKGDNNQI
ncbi:hypothetical protein JXA27_06730 [Aerococcaceae bacterium zg-B36]|uniref:hypothetical protein n=1 Tax=Aerococcaceae bacterium zg-252 TaxID=2796928 RepID=UPI001BD84CC0|nr:hypothetical protein [Aerococcaceae bacterium zg-B36]